MADTLAPSQDDMALIRALDGGWHGVAHAPGAPFGTLAPVPDLLALAARTDGRDFIAALPPQQVYFALKQLDAAEAQEVLPLISQEQFTRILDYDTWREDRLQPGKVFEWLKAYAAIGPMQMGLRFRNLEEEYQLATLDQLIRIYDEEDYETMPPEMQDTLYRMPCNTVFYEIVSDDPEVAQTIEQLIESALSIDVPYAYSLIGHAAYIPPHESEATLTQFRKARLEEDGFVGMEESQRAFIPLTAAELKAKQRPLPAGHGGGQALAAPAQEGARTFLERVWQTARRGYDQTALEALPARFAYLVNSLATATRVEPGQPVALAALTRRATDLLTVGLEYLSCGDEDQAATLLLSEHPHTLFRAGLAVIQPLRDAATASLAAWHHTLGERLAAFSRGGKCGAALRLIDTDIAPIVGFGAAEALRGVFSRFPLVPVATDLGQKARMSSAQNLADVRTLAAHVASLTALLRLYGCADAPHGVPAERIVATMVGRIALTEDCLARPLTATERANLRAVPTPRLQSALQELASLIADMPLGTGIGDDILTMPTAPVVKALTEQLLHDLGAGLILAREHGTDPNAHVLTAEESP